MYDNYAIEINAVSVKVFLISQVPSYKIMKPCDPTKSIFIKCIVKQYFHDYRFFQNHIFSKSCKLGYNIH